MKTLLTSSLFVFCSFIIHDKPIEITWEDLKIPEMHDVYIEELDAYYWEAQFSDEQISMNGDYVKIEGYIECFDFDDPFYVLQKNRSSGFSCCSFPQPDELIDLSNLNLSISEFKEIRLKKISVTGKINLNIEHDIYRMDYRINNPVIVEVDE